MVYQEMSPEREALRLAYCADPAPRATLKRTREKSLTKRGVLWLGQTCNLRCQFCYFIDRVADQNHPEHRFMPLGKAKAICRTVREEYGNDAIDIQGGEPTLYREIFDLISYCRDIGLSPTLITNALLLDDMDLCRRYREAGVKDFLVSVQGLGEVHDSLVGCLGAHRRQMRALTNLQELGIPFRFNVVMSKGAAPQLPGIARLAVATGAYVVNFITFNPFADQGTGSRRCTDNVPRYGEVAPFLTEALDLLEEAGTEGNVRYFPFCMVEERHRKSVYNFQQLSYDPHEWDFASWGWTGLEPQRTAEGEPSPVVALNAARGLVRHKKKFKALSENLLLRPLLYQGHRLLSRLCAIGSGSIDELYRAVAKLHSEVHCGYTYGAECGSCALQRICDGFHGDYAKLFGMEEASLVAGALIDDELHYCRSQMKIILPEKE